MKCSICLCWLSKNINAKFPEIINIKFPQKHPYQKLIISTLCSDIAARNCLLDEFDVCKISDFGMSLYSRGRYGFRARHGGHIPVRWLAPESLKFGAYTHKTDVWAFGVLMYEILSDGTRPYYEVEDRRIKKGVIEGTVRAFRVHCGAIKSPKSNILCPEDLLIC